MDDNYIFIERKYVENEIELNKYLLKISKYNYNKNNNLLKYFGLSFFHDYIILNVHFNISKKVLNLYLTSDIILEDINEFRCKNKLPLINYNSFMKNPVIYECKFYYIREIDFNLNVFDENTILDTEILKYDKTKGIKVLISLFNKKNIIFYTKKTQVRILNNDLVTMYNGGLNRKIKLCPVCKSKLLSNKKIKGLKVKGSCEDSSKS
jgi:hypothetical protein